jgi:hypothetical protein
VDDGHAPLELESSSADNRPVTYRLPRQHIAWLDAEAARTNTSANQVVRLMVFCLGSWFGMPWTMGSRIEENRRAMKLDRRSYLQHLLVRRYDVIREQGAPLPVKSEVQAALETVREQREGSAGTPYALRLTKDYIQWIQDQAALYDLSAAGYVRLMIEDFANWFSVPPTIATVLAQDQFLQKLDFRRYMQFLVSQRYDLINAKGTMHESLHYRFPPTSEYTKEQRQRKLSK